MLTIASTASISGDVFALGRDRRADRQADIASVWAKRQGTV